MNKPWWNSMVLNKEGVRHESFCSVIVDNYDDGLQDGGTEEGSKDNPKDGSSSDDQFQNRTTICSKIC